VSPPSSPMPPPMLRCIVLWLRDDERMASTCREQDSAGVPEQS
jgi:hypothetical protein